MPVFTQEFYLHVKIRKADQKPLLLWERRTTICLHSSARSSESHAHTHVEPAHAAYTFHLHLSKEKSHFVHSQPPCLQDQNKLRRRALGHQQWVKVCQSRGEAISDAKVHADFSLRLRPTVKLQRKFRYVKITCSLSPSVTQDKASTWTLACWPHWCIFDKYIHNKDLG